MDVTLFTNTNCPNCTIHSPKEAFFFIPSRDNQLIYCSKNPKKSIRLIFEKTDANEYLPHENEYYYKFIKYLEENPIELPKGWTESDTRKCLQASGWDFKKTIKKMKTNINCLIPNMDLNDIKDILSSGAFYMHGLDCNYRPILCVIVSKFVKIMDLYPLDNFIYAIYVFINYLSKHFFIPGQVENYVILVDLSNVSFWKPPLKILKIFDFLQNKYLCRLSNLYVYGMNYVLNMCWKIIKKLIDERTSQKFNFISGTNDIKKYVLSKIHPSQLEKKFGGAAENIPNDIKFPFFLPDGIYQIDERNKSQIISEEEYIEMAKNNKLVTISPYLIQEGKIRNHTINNNNSNECNDINNDIKIKFNEKGNPVYGGEEFFECESNMSKEDENDHVNEKEILNISENVNSNLGDEIEDRKILNNYTNKNKNNKLYNKRNRTELFKKGISDSIATNEINTVFELGEERVNCCHCQACLIF